MPNTYTGFVDTVVSTSRAFGWRTHLTVLVCLGIVWLKMEMDHRFQHERIAYTMACATRNKNKKIQRYRLYLQCAYRHMQPVCLFLGWVRSAERRTCQLCNKHWVFSSGVEGTKAPFVIFSVSKVFDLAKVPAGFFQSLSCLTGVNHQGINHPQKRSNYNSYLLVTTSIYKFALSWCRL